MKNTLVTAKLHDPDWSGILAFSSSFLHFRAFRESRLDRSSSSMVNLRWSFVRDRFNGCAKEFVRIAACCALSAELIAVPASVSASEPATAVEGKKVANDPVLKIMQAELLRANSELGKTDQAPYYLSYTVYDQEFVVLVGAYGSLLTDAAAKRRQADVTMRVGSPALDNTHGQSRASGVTSGALPLSDDQDAIGRVLWELTYREYKRAVPSLMNVRTSTAVRAEEEDKSPDFSKEASATHIGRRSQTTLRSFSQVSGGVLRQRDAAGAKFQFTHGE
jgi:hypothetical protein